MVENRHKLAEERLEAANVVELRDEGGLPLTEIVEELDDDDNIVSSTVSKPGSAAPQIIEALRQSGISDVSDQRPESNDEIKAEPNPQPNALPSEDEIPSKVNIQEKTPATRKKSVTFADDPVIQANGSRHTLPERTNGTSSISSESRTSEPTERHPGPRSTNNAANQPVIPENETPEEAALRREMLEYSLNEVGAIVAEMDLDEEEDELYTSESDGEDDEDNFGRTTRRIVDEDYMTRMLELERKLNAKALANAGPVSTTTDSQTLESKASKTLIGGDLKVGPTEDASTTAKKGVRFAEKLDIQEAPELSSSVKEGTVTAPITPKNPVAPAIVERSIPDTTSSHKPKPQTKTSKFKTARAATPSVISTASHNDQSSGTVFDGPLAGLGSSAQLYPANQKLPKKEVVSNGQRAPPTVEEGSSRKTHADVLVERPMVENERNIREPDELDPVLMHQEIAVEYHRMRNRIIQRNGGFTAAAHEEREATLPETEAGGRKVSRFKAARLDKDDR